MIKERPILFSIQMVLALLERRKTQTRRVVKPQPPFGCSYEINGARSHALCFQTEYGTKTAEAVWVNPTAKSTDHRLPCPYGHPGDRIWVKETHFSWGKWVRNGRTKTGKPAWRFKALAPNERKVLYVAGEPIALPEKIKRTDIAWHKRPSIFMPRWASRITLELTSVKVERLGDISHKDALAEGVEYDVSNLDGSPLARFKKLWESINGKGSWDKNPWVWKIEFKRL